MHLKTPIILIQICFTLSLWGQTAADAEKKPANRAEQIQQVIKEQGRIALQYARELNKLGYPLKSLQIFNDFLTLYPNHEWTLDALIQTADILKALDRPQEAVGYYIQAFQHAMDSERAGRAYLSAGRILLLEGEFGRARKIFTELELQKSPISGEAALELSSLRLMAEKTVVSTDSAMGNKEEIDKVGTKTQIGEDGVGK